MIADLPPVLEIVDSTDQTVTVDSDTTASVEVGKHCHPILDVELSLES